jgi:hypothetical protein
MKFEKFEDLIQVFVNEYITPKSLILVIGPGEYIPFFKTIFKFLNTDSIFLDTFWYQGINVTSELNVLPFENKSFDFVISLKRSEDLFRICKNEILVKEEIINAKENYLLYDAIYSVI